MIQNSTDRIVDELRAFIRSAPAGAQLPASRELVDRHQVSPVTVQKALRQLIAAGLIESRPGVGTFVRGAAPLRSADYSWQTAALGAPSRVPAVSPTQRGARADAIQLHAGYPARDLLPARLVRQAFARAAKTDAALVRQPPAGMPELQEWFGAELASVTPAGITPPSARDAIVIPGTQSGLASIFRSLVAPGESLVIESPTYWGAMLAAAQADVRLVPVASGPTGPDPADVDRALAVSGARAFFAQTTFANPLGGQWSDATSRAVLDIVRSRGAFLIEDDWAHDFGIDASPRPVAALDDDGHVIYLRSLSKSISPSVRVGAVIARGAARDRILADRAAESLYVSGLLQAAALDVVTQPGWGTHLRSLRGQLRARRDLLLASLAEHAPQVRPVTVPVGGLNLWLRLPDGVDSAAVVRECEMRGVLIADGSEWFPAEPTGSFVRAQFSGEQPDRFGEAARVIGAVVASAG